MSATGFSYAQAARGQAVPQITTPVTSSITPLAATKEENVDFDSTTFPEADTALILSVTADTSKLASPEFGSGSRKVDSDAGSATDSATLIGTLVESTSNLSLDDGSAYPAASYKNGQVSALATRSSSSDDSARKGWKGKTAKTSSKDSDPLPVEENEKEREVVKTVLSPAPVPVKNIWDERRRELAAKSKQTPVATSKPDPSATATGVVSAISETVKSKDARKSNGLPTDHGASLETSVPSAVAKSQPRRLSETSRAEQIRRNGSRPSRAMDKDAKNQPSRSALPSVQDATLWPTPESAAFVEDPKAKTPTEKTDKIDNGDNAAQEEGALAKSRKKGAWVTLDFVPTVNFQTPLLNVRGSKPKTGGRGGRDSSSRGGYGGVTNGSTPSEKAVPVTTSLMDKAGPDFRDKSREANGSATTARHHMHSSNSAKRFSTDSTHARETRKPSVVADPGKQKDAVSNYSGLPAKAEYVPKGNHASGVNGEIGSNHHIAHPMQSDRRFATAKNMDHHASPTKENGTTQSKEQGLNARERTETRGERTGRGGFRGGRGGHANSASQGHQFSRLPYQPNGQRATSNGAAYSSNVSSLPPAAAPFNPSPQQHSFGYTSNPPRLGRASGRTQSVSQVPSFSNRLQNGVTNNSRVHGHAAPALMTVAPTEFHIQQTYPFPAFSPMETDHFQALVKQLEYYFSLENLCKDMFLRRKMDGQGFVPLPIVAEFRRMTELAPAIDFIRAACEQSEKLDYVIDMDQNELVRSRAEWRKFILPAEQRMEEARGPGPDMRTVYFRSFHSRPQQPYFPAAFAAGYPSTAQTIFPTAAYTSNGTELMFPPYDNGASVEHAAGPNGNAQVNGAYAGESQLSATVPDFSPASISGAPTTLEDYQNCPDEQVEKLVVVVASDTDLAAATVSESGGKNVGLSNGSHSPHDDVSSNSRGHASGTTLEAQSEGGTSETDMTAAPSTAAKTVGEEPYPKLRARAFDQRKHSKSGETPAAMKHLYRFWSHCLPDKFNVRMYEDFRSSALDDAGGEFPNDFGLRYLLRYYNHVLIDSAGLKPCPSVFVPHFTEAKELSESWKAASSEA